MEKKEETEIEIKRDELGIVPINAEEKILSDIKKMITDSDLSKEENRKRFAEIIKDYPDLIESFSDYAYYRFVSKVAEECDDFDTREYLADVYVEKKKVIEGYDISTYSADGSDWTAAIEEYIDYDEFNSKWEKYYEATEEERDADIRKLSEEKRNIGELLVGEQIDGEKHITLEEQIELKTKYKKLEDRIDKLSEDDESIHTLINDPYAYEGIPNYIDKIQRYAEDNCLLFFDTDEFFTRLVNDINQDKDSHSAWLYISAIAEYKKKLKSGDSENEESNRTSGRNK